MRITGILASARSSEPEMLRSADNSGRVIAPLCSQLDKNLKRDMDWTVHQPAETTHPRHRDQQYIFGLLRKYFCTSSA